MSWVGLWEAIANSGDLGGDDEAAELACERWRRAEQGERHDFWFRLMSVFGSQRSEWTRLTHAIRAGVPASLRGNVWFVCSGAARKRREARRRFPELVAAGRQLRGTEAARVIEADVPRTGVVGEQRSKLEAVLLAFAANNAEIGYCQSMNYIAATFMLYMGEDEDRAFWMLCSVIEDLLPSGYYTPTMLGLRVDLRVFDALVEHYLPAVRRHLLQIDVDLSPITMNWFLCLFVNTLPIERSHRVVDSLLHEGSKVIFRAALAILRLRQSELLQIESVTDAYDLLKAPFGTDVEETREEADELIKQMYGPWLRGLSTDTVDALRREHQARVSEEDEAAEERCKAFAAKSGRPLPPHRTGRAEAELVASPQPTDAPADAPADDDAAEARDELSCWTTPADRLRRKSVSTLEGLHRGSTLGFRARATGTAGDAASWLTMVSGDGVAVDEADDSHVPPQRLARIDSERSP